MGHRILWWEHCFWSHTAFTVLLFQLAVCLHKNWWGPQSFGLWYGYWPLVWILMRSCWAVLKLLSKLSVISHIYQKIHNCQLFLFKTNKIWKSIYFWILHLSSKVRMVCILFSLCRWLWNYSLNVQRGYLTLVTGFMCHVGLMMLCSAVLRNRGCTNSPWVSRLWQYEKFRVN